MTNLPSNSTRISKNPPQKEMKSRNGEGLNTDNLGKMEVLQPHLSGSYIRSLVKEVTSSRTKDSSKTSEENSMISTAQDGFLNKQEKTHLHKRKVRRRVQTRRPYQDRMLNMAEARREIVSALKLHREAMKLKQQMKSGPEIQPESQQVCLGQEAPNSSISCNNFSYSSPEPNLDFVLPTQTLGLNLNLQDFYNLDTGSPSIHSSSSTSSSSVLSSATEEIPQTAAAPPLPPSVEFGDRDFVRSPFDEVKEFPGWFNANESCLEHIEDLCFYNHYFGDYAFPCMDIEEIKIEGVDGDWLA